MTTAQQFDHVELTRLSGITVGYGARSEDGRLRGVSVDTAMAHGEEESVARALNALIGQRATPQRVAELCLSLKVGEHLFPYLRANLPALLERELRLWSEERAAIARALLPPDEWGRILAPACPECETGGPAARVDYAHYSTGPDGVLRHRKV